MWLSKRMQAQRLSDTVMDLIPNLAYDNEHQAQVLAFKSKGRTH